MSTLYGDNIFNINEGFKEFFTKRTKYTITRQKYNKGYTFNANKYDKSFTNTKSTAVEYFIFDNEYTKATKTENSIQIIKDTDYILDDDYIIYLYKVKFKGDIDTLILGDKKYIVDSVEFEGPLHKLLTKLGIKVEVVDNPDYSKITSERKVILNKAKTIAKSVLNNAKNMPEFKGGFSLSNEVDDDYLKGFSEYTPLIDYDITSIKNVGNYRDYVNDPGFQKVFCYIGKELEKQIESNISNATSDYTGDWDDGSFDLMIKNEE